MSKDTKEPAKPQFSRQLTTIRLNIEDFHYTEVYICSHTEYHIRQAFEKSYKKYKLNPLAICKYTHELEISKETYDKIKSTGFLKIKDNKKSIYRYNDTSSVPYETSTHTGPYYFIEGLDVLYNLFIYMCQLEDPTIQFIHIPCEEFFLG